MTGRSDAGTRQEMCAAGRWRRSAASAGRVRSRSPRWSGRATSIRGSGRVSGSTPEAVESVIRTGDLPPELSGHIAMHMYRWSELQALLGRHQCQIVAASASSLSFGRLHQELISGLSEAERERLVRWEVELAAEPGAVSMGEHIIAVVRKPGAGGGLQIGDVVAAS